MPILLLPQPCRSYVASHFGTNPPILGQVFRPDDHNSLVRTRDFQQREFRRYIIRAGMHAYFQERRGRTLDEHALVNLNEQFFDDPAAYVGVEK